MAYRESRTPASKGKSLDHIRIHEGEDGGHMVEHHYHEDGMVFHKPKQYTFGKDEGDDLMHHIEKHMHVNRTSGEEEEVEPAEERIKE